jgi:hypothetical protein
MSFDNSDLLGLPAPPSMLFDNSDLLGLPGPPLMPFYYSAVTRTISSPNDYPTRGSNNPYTPGIFLDSTSDHQPPASNNRLPPGPGPDQITRTNETDEGYFTNSQLDAQSVHNMNNVWNKNQERQNIQAREMLVPPAHWQPGPENTSPEQPSDLRYQKPVHNNVNLSQQRPHSLACEYKDCGHRSKTQSDFRYVLPVLVMNIVDRCS